MVGAVPEHIAAPVGPAHAATLPTLAEGVAEDHGDLTRFGLPHDAEVGAVDLPAHIGAVRRTVSGHLTDQAHGLHQRRGNGGGQRSGLGGVHDRRRCGLRLDSILTGHRDRNGFDLRTELYAWQADRGGTRARSGSGTGARPGVGRGFRIRIGGGIRWFRRVPNIRARIAARIRRQRFRIDPGIVRRRIGDRNRRDLGNRHRNIDLRRQLGRGLRRRCVRVRLPIQRVESDFATTVHRRRGPRMLCGSRDGSGYGQRTGQQHAEDCGCTGILGRRELPRITRPKSHSWLTPLSIQVDG